MWASKRTGWEELEKGHPVQMYMCVRVFLRASFLLFRSVFLVISAFEKGPAASREPLTKSVPCSNCDRSGTARARLLHLLKHEACNYKIFDVRRLKASAFATKGPAASQEPFAKRVPFLGWFKGTTGKYVFWRSNGTSRSCLRVLETRPC